MRLKIYIPNNNIEERIYILNTLVSEFLGISYDLIISNETSDYTLLYDNKKLVIRDFFFNKYVNDLSYLNLSQIPQTLDWFDGSPLVYNKIPIIYGSDSFELGADTIICGLDIFASSFFMLTRWEEIVIPKKDRFRRCDESEMFVVKTDLYKRPIVNEYCEFLRSMLGYLGIPLGINQRKFEVFLTHDIDDLFRFSSVKNFIKNLLGDLLHRKSLKIFVETCRDYVRFRRKIIKDPFDTFDDFLDFDKSYGFKHAFYFKALRSGEYDCTYDIFDSKIKSITNNILRQGHEIGIHPSMLTFGNFQQFKIEFDRLKSIGLKIRGGRQHFLLYQIPDTFNFWNDMDELEYDSGLGFYDRIGFRCGCCYEYTMFDNLKRKELRIRQKPLVVMEGAAVVEITKKSLPIDNMYLDIIELIDIVYKYNGLFVFLWHNDNLNRYHSKKFKHIYFDVITYLGKLCKVA